MDYHRRFLTRSRATHARTHAGEYERKTTIGTEQKTTYKDTARNYRKDPAISIPATGREQREKVFISKQHFENKDNTPGE